MQTSAIPDPLKCEWCGNFHAFKCPLVKSIEYDVGMIKKVEFFAPNDFPQIDKIPFGPAR